MRVGGTSYIFLRIGAACCVTTSFRRAHAAKVFHYTTPFEMEGVCERSPPLAATPTVSERRREQRGLKHLFLTATSALDSTRIRQASRWPYQAQLCSGVRCLQNKRVNMRKQSFAKVAAVMKRRNHLWATALWSALHCSSRRQTSGLPLQAASCNGVQSLEENEGKGVSEHETEIRLLSHAQHSRAVCARMQQGEVGGRHLLSFTSGSALNCRSRRQMSRRPI